MKVKRLLLLVMLMIFFQHGYSQNYQKTDLGVKATTQSIQIEVQFYSPEIVRILKSPEGVPFVKKSLSVIKEPVKTDLKITTEGNKVVLQSSSMKVQLDTQTGKVSYFTLAGEPLFTEKEYGVQFTPITDVDTKTFIVRQAFLLDKDEAIYGLGQH